MAAEEIRRTPPYGPAKGMLEGLKLIQRSSPTLVDQKLLRDQGIAKGNEYKVIGALRYLGLIDEHGRLTERARDLRTRGPLLKLNLQKIVENAYPSLFRALDLKTTNRDEVYNHFLTELNLPPEMASKATRFFIELARAAEFRVGGERSDEGGDEGRGEVARRTVRPISAEVARRPISIETARAIAPSFTIPLPAASLSMSEDELAELFRKYIKAWEKAAS